MRAALFHWAIAVGTAVASARAARPPPGTLDRSAGAAGRSPGLRASSRGPRRPAALPGLAAARRSTPSVAEFFSAIGLPIVEGYGLTETAPILTVNPPGAPRVGTVGRSLPGVDMRIADDGEILARGPNVMPATTTSRRRPPRSSRTAGSTPATSARIDEDGYLSITDRKKDLLVTSGGKKIAPQPIEADPQAQPARRRSDACSASGASSPPRSSSRTSPRSSAGSSRSAGRRASATSSSSGADVVSLYEEIVDALNRELSQFERIKRIALLPAEFTIESGELTPTLKVKRRVVEQKWHAGDRGALFGQTRIVGSRESGVESESAVGSR